MMRRPTRPIRIGPIPVGGDAPVVIQSMTSTHTHDIDVTVAQIHRLVQAGAEVVRVAVADLHDTQALPKILKQVPCPIIADVHYHYERALEAIEAGVHKIRLNPGNLQDRDQVHRVIDACKDHGIPIRIGVNEGSIVERIDKTVREAEKSKLAREHHSSLIRLMMEKLTEYLKIFDDRNFRDVVLSAKSIDPIIVIEAYREISRRFDHPLHLGLTHAGPPETGRIRSVAALATLLAEGIGDTIRISYAADPVVEVTDAKELLCSLGLRKRTEPELIACPICGRIEIDLIKLVGEVRRRLTEINVPIKVAIMGCVVNGPGECEQADVALFAGRGKGILYVRGEQKRTVSEEQMVDALIEECRSLANQWNRP